MKILNKLKEYDYITFYSDIEFIDLRLVARGQIGPFKRLISFFLQLFKSLKKCSLATPSVDTLFVWGTKNQKSALMPLYNEMVDGGMSTTNASCSHLVGGEFDIPILYAYILSLPFIFVALIEYFFNKKNTQFRKRMDYSFDSYVLSFGQLIIFENYLKKAKPKTIIVSNDHNSDLRILIQLAKKYNVKTVYLQHASVSVKFPPLSQFDMALLDGESAKATYQSVGALAKNTFLVGIAKLDPYKIKAISREKGKSIVIGIALNALYNQEVLKKLLNVLELLPNKQVIIRPHPGGARNQKNIKILANEYLFSISSPEAETTGEFLSKTNVLLAGNSGVLLEAAILDVTPIYIELDNSIFDYYGFVKYGVAKYLDMGLNEKKIILSFSQEFIPSAKSVKYFDESIGSSFYGESAKKSFEYVKYFIEKHQVKNINNESS